MVTHLQPYLHPLSQGLCNTLIIFFGGAVIALTTSFIVGLGKLSSNPVLRYSSVAYIEILRGTSALVQLFWVYFALPMLGIEVSALWAGIIVLGLNGGAYGAEIVRGAIQSVPKTQYLAAQALNMTKRQIMGRIIIPQAFIRMVPPFGNLFIELLKNTALVSLITVSDLTFQAQIIRTATLKTVEVFAGLLVIYFLLAMGIRSVMKILEKRLSVGIDYGGMR